MTEYFKYTYIFYQLTVLLGNNIQKKRACPERTNSFLKTRVRFSTDSIPLTFI
jgi:hypothetical protein